MFKIADHVHRKNRPDRPTGSLSPWYVAHGFMTYLVATYRHFWLKCMNGRWRYIQRKTFSESLSKKTETCTRTYNFGTLSLATVAQKIVSNVKWYHELLALDIHNAIEEKLKQSDQNWLSRHGCDTSYEVPQIGFGGPVLATISGTFARVKPLRGLEALPRLDLG